jgi:hypothetical protein
MPNYVQSIVNDNVNNFNNNKNEDGKNINHISNFEKQGGFLEGISDIKEFRKWNKEARDEINVEFNIAIYQTSEDKAKFYVLPWEGNST